MSAFAVKSFRLWDGSVGEIVEESAGRVKAVIDGREDQPVINCQGQTFAAAICPRCRVRIWPQAALRGHIEAHINTDARCRSFGKALDGRLNGAIGENGGVETTVNVNNNYGVRR